jgi:uncharacterized membrane protein YkoI
VAVAGLIWLGALAAPAWADNRNNRDNRDDHERARAAVQAGEVLPLPQVLERLQRTHPGQVLEVELERDDGRWLYEVKLLRSDGQLRKLKLDARSAQVLNDERKGGPAQRAASEVRP